MNIIIQIYNHLGWFLTIAAESRDTLPVVQIVALPQLHLSNTSSNNIPVHGFTKLYSIERLMCFKQCLKIVKKHHKLNYKEEFIHYLSFSISYYSPTVHMRFFRVLTLIASSHKPKIEAQFPLDSRYPGLRVGGLRPTPTHQQPINTRFDGEPLCGSERLAGHWRSPSHVPGEGGKFSDSAKSKHPAQVRYAFFNSIIRISLKNECTRRKKCVPITEGLTDLGCDSLHSAG